MIGFSAFQTDGGAERTCLGTMSSAWKRLGSASTVPV